MSWYIASAALLLLATVAAAGTATRWPVARRDVYTALSTAAAVAFWLVFDAAHPGPTLVAAADVTVADLAGLPALALAGLLMGRTVILARRHALAVEQETARLARAQAAERALAAERAAEAPVEETADQP